MHSALSSFIVTSLLAPVALLAQSGQPATEPGTKPPAAAPQNVAPDSSQPASPAAPVKPESAPAAPVKPYVLDFKVNDIDGAPQDLNQYKGRVVMIINVASKCGYTRQYAALQKLYEEKKDQGFVILAFPANNFGNQEPGTDSEIKSFCMNDYNVTFPLFSKISVAGKDKHPLFAHLSAQPGALGGDPEWNFTKFLVNREGNVVARFQSRVTPSDPELRRTIDDLLAARSTAAVPSEAPANTPVPSQSATPAGQPASAPVTTPPASPASPSPTTPATPPSPNTPPAGR